MDTIKSERLSYIEYYGWKKFLWLVFLCAVVAINALALVISIFGG